ncbi:MAG TPA: metallophosphoesterase [Vicinamibacterales bacterium]|jgi:predicted phosphodiesterase|nr:metallophosphoesterase [Vicinamibacterales bacterium]
MRRVFLFVLIPVAVACAMPEASVTAQTQVAAQTPVAAAPAPQSVPAGKVILPNKAGSIKFAVIGDTGTGDKHQLAVAKQLAATRSQFPFEFVIMVGDNIYGGNSSKDFENKFSTPYKPLLDGGIKFYAALGNHDDPSERFYKPFNMNGERYYSFKPADGVRFYALDSTYMDDKQLKWFEDQLKMSGSEWKIAFFHHPPYSSGETHGSDETLRTQLEPLFVKYGINVVLTGHEHFYERIKPQKGIAYFITGSSAKLREGNIKPADFEAAGFDTGYTFMVVEIIGDDMYYQAMTDGGKTVDSGSVHRVGKVEPTPNRTAQPIVPTTGNGKKLPPAGDRK